MINFYHMHGCHHCVTAHNELQSLIDCGKIIMLGHEAALKKGVQGFPYFELVDADNKVLKTSRGWSGKQNLFDSLGYIPTCENYQENYQNQYMNHQNDPNQNYQDMNHQNYNDPNHQNNFPVVENMETVSTDVLYRHHKGGYSKLSNCWVKQSNYTA